MSIKIAIVQFGLEKAVSISIGLTKDIHNLARQATFTE